MKDSGGSLESLGAALDRADTALRALHRRQEQGDLLGRILAEADASAPRNLGLRSVLVLASVPVAALLCFVLWPAATESHPWFTVGRTGTRGIVGREIEASGSTPIAFSDGTRIELAPLARAKVASMTGRDTVLMLRSGSLEAHVTTVRNHVWVFSAGPFQVLVHGTAFRLAWDPAKEVFRLELEEGVVGVRGPLLGAEKVVGRSQSLYVALLTGTVRLDNAAKYEAPAAPTESASTPPAVAAVPDRGGSSSVGRLPIRAGSPHAEGKTCEPWQEVARQPGHTREAVAAAECAGMFRLIATLPVAELVRLGDLTRASGDALRARQVLLAIRRRFPSTDESAVSAYLMGRTELELGQRPGTAARWFAVYLKERPSGALEAAALGRLVESLNANGQTQEARHRAEEYVERFPKGAHRDIANQLLGP